MVYVGGTSNRHLGPAVWRAYTQLARRQLFLVGSDYAFGRVAGEILAPPG